MKSKKRSNIRLPAGLLAVALIAGFVLLAPKLIMVEHRSESKIAQIHISDFKLALQAFFADTSRFPTTAEGLDALVRNPGNLEGWNGPYLAKDVPLDPWGRAYVYKCPGEHGEFDLYSYGRDGVAVSGFCMLVPRSAFLVQRGTFSPALSRVGLPNLQWFS
jgi:general secretion pathway protein G